MNDPAQDQGDLVIRKLHLLPGLARACNARMGNRLSAADLDEVVQEASLTAWTSRANFRGDGSIDAWIYGIVRISILRFLSAERRRSDREVPMPERVPDLVGHERSPGTSADSGFRHRVRQALRDAGTNIEAIFVGHDLDGRTFGAIGEGLKWKETRVKSQYYRCIPGLRRTLEKLWDDLSGC